MEKTPVTWKVLKKNFEKNILTPVIDLSIRKIFFACNITIRKNI